jgi:hypothetical protein
MYFTGHGLTVIDSTRSFSFTISFGKHFDQSTDNLNGQLSRKKGCLITWTQWRGIGTLIRVFEFAGLMVPSFLPQLNRSIF